MNKNLIITISIIVGVLLLAILIYYFATKPGKVLTSQLEIEKAKQKLESIEDELLEVFSRWEELESLK